MQTNVNFNASSVNEPPLGVTAASAPAAGTLPASRIQVIPLSPISNWVGITHSEPYVSTATNTVHVTFHGSPDVQFNAWFWDPHTLIGPGQAMTYNSED